MKRFYMVFSGELGRFLNSLRGSEGGSRGMERGRRWEGVSVAGAVVDSGGGGFCREEGFF